MPTQTAGRSQPVVCDVQAGYADAKSATRRFFAYKKMSPAYSGARGVARNRGSCSASFEVRVMQGARHEPLNQCRKGTCCL